MQGDVLKIHWFMTCISLRGACAVYVRWLLEEKQQKRVRLHLGYGNMCVSPALMTIVITKANLVVTSLYYFTMYSHRHHVKLKNCNVTAVK
jgi:hypothetical protein